ncbi:GmrSD restriction endonuclease domain-containing protein [Metaplanococcus flavidus]|uniref:HNH endonuclease family protein n=1 Tax=Metaplanococcus flavidus TaxID=569883 RepID=A0ABW3L6E0_9BACL
MADLFLKDEEIKEIFKNHIKIDSKVMSIETLFANERRTRSTVFDPYYQRNYVWDTDKATYFIESILLGTEIPPLVFFNTGKNIEVIDGRQRFETIKRFKDNQFHLTKNGLNIFGDLQKKSFGDFDVNLQDVFWDTKLRIIEFSIVNEPKLDYRKEDQIKKEIFRRYNSGITPLKNAEIEKAIYINDDTTTFFKRKFKEGEKDYIEFLDIFFSEREKELGKKGITLEKAMSKVRVFLVLHNIPINYYSTSKSRKELIQKFFESLSENTQDVEELYNNFFKKIELLKIIKNKLSAKKVEHNKLVFECLFWAFTIMEQEGINLERINKEDINERLINFIGKNINIYTTENSHFYKEMKERYSGTASFFEDLFNINFEIYIKNNVTTQKKLKTIMNNSSDTHQIIEVFESLRLNKPDASSTTIDDICRLMNRKRFLVRPSYQRGESINQMKSSAIIESILLGINLPPIFIYKRLDGILEVVDGQQRLLSILGFIGEEFLDENGELSSSEKNNYKLNKLRILDELNGKSYQDLNDVLKEKILDFNLSLVTIDAKINPQFDPIDLFIRLNNKPYPIRENTFEMWNSYVDHEIVSKIKQVVSKNNMWFYSKLQNTRMENEELITTLAYFEYKEEYPDANDDLDIYQRTDKINFRVKSKVEITKVLNIASEEEEIKRRFLKSISEVEKFLKKLKLLLVDKDVSENVEDYLKEELTKLFYLQHSKGARRTLQSFYALWNVLSKISYEMIRLNRIKIKEEISSLFAYTKSLPLEDQNGDGIKKYQEMVLELWDGYKVDGRRITLSHEEKQSLLKKQQNQCPLCTGLLFISDELEVDHRIPLGIGGRDKFLNLQLAHKDCNRRKGIKIEHVPSSSLRN